VVTSDPPDWLSANSVAVTTHHATATTQAVLSQGASTEIAETIAAAAGTVGLAAGGLLAALGLYLLCIGGGFVAIWLFFHLLGLLL
jgi:predicted lipid-binding transport protein (Tim44 family)